MYALARDLRFAFRQLRKAPGFSLIVVLTLALGIGATTAIFSLVEGILLRPLPFSDPDCLVLLGDHLGSRPNTSVTAREIGTYSKASSAFASLGGYITANYELSGGVVPEQVPVGRLTAGVFPTLGAPPILGRVFSQQEEDSHQPLAVISYVLWLNRYHRDPHVLGSSIVLDRKVYSIIGVMPRSFEFPLQAGRLNQAQLWVPMSLTPDELSDGNAGSWGYHLLGLAFAATAIRTALHLLPESMPRIGSISMNATVAIFGLLIALVSGILCSLAPAFAALRTNLIQSLKAGAQTGAGGSSHAWLRSSLIVSEIAIALVLLTVSGAFLRSFQKMRSVDPGFRPDHVLVAGYRLPLNQYPTDASVESFNHAVVDRLSGKPGIVAAGIINVLPASGFSALA